MFQEKVMSSDFDISVRVMTCSEAHTLEIFFVEVPIIMAFPLGQPVLE
jgi:hypothetical protein